MLSFRQWIRAAFERVGRLRTAVVRDDAVFIEDTRLGVKRRSYETYKDYLIHQANKLGKVGQAIEASDREYEAIVRGRYGESSWAAGHSILCLGARLGGEVRAFKSLGALAIGIDIEPGARNQHVLFGDFHQIAFPDSSFDYAFTNVIDHVFDLPLFSSEVGRVLKPGGVFLVEFGQVAPGAYEVLDTREAQPFIKEFDRQFDLIGKEAIRNTTSYFDWSGQLLRLRCRKT